MYESLVICVDRSHTCKEIYKWDDIVKWETILISHFPTYYLDQFGAQVYERYFRHTYNICIEFITKN